jgi:hypothetical protein
VIFGEFVLQDVILKLTAEVRQPLGLQLAISRALVDLRVVQEFQRTVVEIIRDEDPEPPGASSTASRNGERFPSVGG